MAEQYTLYYHDYSLCANMVRFSLAIAGEPRDASSEMQVEEKAVDIFRGAEQLEEYYLCHINPKGQVPALASKALPKPMAESLDMTLYIAEHYPALIPEAHHRETTAWLRELHGLNYFALSFGDRPQQAQAMVKAIQARLGQDGISPEYRKALEYKLEVTNKEKIQAMAPAARAANEERAKDIAAKLESTLQSGKQWLFGSDRPSALDAHLAVYLARLRDVKREDLIPGRLGTYLEHAMSMPEWEQVMQGRKTMPGI
ncbi:hypothetical protein BAUCODRAFT_34669 [Baudoinia panamericana UAMH 10762]|uniref:GST N-terminal domain-containing protein n=1 Tax=Baudoinia panamericana (strain UAMH 10762) TaxID=717646 RepID=M2NAP0_BAUPA|nr:uncharacterized protein BAUCODRAFT_34669 [Baudoinia panamericana UAMH 10762]EMC95910.1 hypothetical protein BAUCODRAFT_34669 [Baudoinia panamericana UAMH 10762]